MAKWGVPEKSIKNAAQRRRPLIRKTLQSKVMAQNRFWEIPPCISLYKKGAARGFDFPGANG